MADAPKRERKFAKPFAPRGSEVGFDARLSPTADRPAGFASHRVKKDVNTFVTEFLTIPGLHLPSQRRDQFAAPAKICAPKKKPSDWGKLSKEEQLAWAEENTVRPGKVELVFIGLQSRGATKKKRAGGRVLGVDSLPYGPAIRFCTASMQPAPTKPVKDAEDALVVMRRYRACVKGGTPVDQCVAAEFPEGPPVLAGLRKRRRR